MTKEQAKAVLELISGEKDALKKSDVFAVIDMIDDSSVLTIPYTPSVNPVCPYPNTTPSLPWSSPFYCNTIAGTGIKPV